jgi:hypothetical protein
MFEPETAAGTPRPFCLGSARRLRGDPSNQWESYDITREAFELSQRMRLPVLIRIVTRLAHSGQWTTSRPRAP